MVYPAQTEDVYTGLEVMEAGPFLVLGYFFLSFQFSNLQNVNKKRPDLISKATVLLLVLRACFTHLGLPVLTKLPCVPVNISLNTVIPFIPSIGSTINVSSWLF